MIRVGEWLRQGRIDAAWTIVDKDAGNARVLWQEPFVVLSSRTHPFATGNHTKLSVADLEGQPVVLRLGCEAKRGRLWPESTRIRVVARAERDELALRLVSQGLGIAIAPLSLAANDVIARSMEGLDDKRSIGLMWKYGTTFSRRCLTRSQLSGARIFDQPASRLSPGARHCGTPRTSLLATTAATDRGHPHRCVVAPHGPNHWRPHRGLGKSR